jgi:hypothetical protein
MTKKKRKDLYTLFQNGAKPTGDDFADFIDSVVNSIDDGIGKHTNQPIKVTSTDYNGSLIDLGAAQDANNIEKPYTWRVKNISSDSGKEGLNFTLRENLDGKEKETSILFLDKNENHVGINNDNPASALDIAGDLAVSGSIKFRSNKDEEFIDLKKYISINNQQMSARYVVADKDTTIADGEKVFNTVNDCLNYIIKNGVEKYKGKIYVAPKKDGTNWKEIIVLQNENNINWSNMEIEFDNAILFKGTIILIGEENNRISNIKIKVNIDNEGVRARGMNCKYTDIKLDGFIHNCSLDDVTGAGGGFHAENSNVEITGDIKNCNSNDNGGGFYADNCNIKVKDIINCSSNAYGGGFYLKTPCNVKARDIMNCRTATSGGGFYFESNSVIRVRYILDCKVKDQENKEEAPFYFPNCDYCFIKLDWCDNKFYQQSKFAGLFAQSKYQIERVFNSDLGASFKTLILHNK